MASHSILAPPSWLRLNLSTSQRSRLEITHTVSISASTYEFWGDTIMQTVTPRDRLLVQVGLTIKDWRRSFFLTHTSGPENWWELWSHALKVFANLKSWSKAERSWIDGLGYPNPVHVEKAMAPHSSTLAWKIPWMEEPGGLQPMGSLIFGTTEWLHFHFSLSYIGEGNGNPIQWSCLEKPRDGGAWWAAIYGVA